MTKVAILGTGMGGFGAAHRLREAGVACELFDKNDFGGGHTVSVRYRDDFVFDMGPHVSFTNDTRIQEIFAEAVEGEYDSQGYKFSNYWEGHWLAHPAQTNLYGLPVDVIVPVIKDFVEQSKVDPVIRNYEDWLVAAYGRSFADWFPGRYTLKYHTTPAANLTTDWMGPRMYRPTLEEVLRGALSPVSPNVHYIQSFRYPRHGGFGAYVASWGRQFPLRLSHEVVAIDPRAKRVTFANGTSERYDALVSSIALPELVKRIAGAPREVVEAAERLACSSCVLVNLGLARNDFASTHVSYFYDLDLCFPRVSYPHIISPNNVPPGHGAIQVEVYFSQKYRPFTGKPAEYIEPVVRDLIRCGILREDDDLLVREAEFVPYANIIFDHDLKAALSVVHGYLDELRIRYCGRFGEWAYYWTDDSFKSGERAAERALGDL